MKINTPPYSAPMVTQRDKNSDAMPPGKATQPWIMLFNSWLTALMGVANYNQKSLQIPLTGFSIQIADNVDLLALTPVGVLATGTVILPANPTNNQSVRVSSSQTITALTLSATHTILNAPTTLAAGTGFSYIYDLATTTWLRVY